MKGWLLVTWALTGKDLRLFLADRRAVVLCFAVPVLLATIFGMIFSQDQTAPKRLCVVLHVDQSEEALHISNLLANHPGLDVKTVPHLVGGEPLQDSWAKLALVITSDLSKPESPPKYQIFYHPTAQMEAQLLEGVLMETIAKKWTAHLQQLPTVREMFQCEKIAVNISQQSSFDAYGHSFTGMTVQYLLFWGLECGLVFLRERRTGIWQRIQASPVTIFQALLARTLATAVIAQMLILVMFTAGNLLFGVRIHGTILAFGVLSITCSFLAAALGVFVAAIGQHEARARSLFVLVILSLSMLGGLWMPAGFLPTWVDRLAPLLPTRWAMDGLREVVMDGGSFPQIVPHLLALLIFIMGFFVLAICRFTWFEAQQRKGFQR
ncbi:MAG: ABC transporter permease [Zavarzinella sp.]